MFDSTKSKIVFIILLFVLLNVYFWRDKYYRSKRTYPKFEYIQEY